MSSATKAKKKRPLKDEAKDYAAELLLLRKKKRRPPPRPKDRLTRCEHVVEVLTRQHGGTFPVAANGGTRPAVCGVLRNALGEEAYEELCPSAAAAAAADGAGRSRATLDAVPSLPAAPRGPAPPPPNVDDAPDVPSMLSRFPDDAGPLLRDGAQRLGPILPGGEVAALTAALADHPLDGGTRVLSPARGSGDAGCYAALKGPLPPLLRVVVDAARRWIERNAGPIVRPLGDRALLLRYGLGGVNYAHRDYCGDFQALLVLSTPGVDYAGGALYLAESDPPFRRTEFPFEAPGELICFRAGRGGDGAVDYLHGMTPVTRGSGAVTRRFAVGLFQ